MYTGEFINLKCTWITHDINGLYELMTIIIFTENQHILKPFCPTTDSLTRPKLYGLFVINNSKSNNIFLFFCLSVTNLKWPTPRICQSQVIGPIVEKGHTLPSGWSIQHFVFLHQRLLNSKHKIGFRFYHRKPNNISIKYLVWKPMTTN